MMQGLPTIHGPQFNSFPLFDFVDQLPEQPRTLGPVRDPDKLDEPLPVFSEKEHADAFGINHEAFEEVSIPPRPAAFCDPYLYPSLAHNEFTRLSMLWYYTEGIQEDKILLRSLSQILELVKQTLPWEFAIIGLVDARTFTRLVTVGTMELAMIPRRESPCSHTINQQPGTVFAIPDMSADWRFEGAPTAGPNGLRSYAGTQVTMYGPAGEVVVLGSICTASQAVQPSLTAQQKSVLIRASVMCSHELATRTQLRRMNTKQTMMEDLAFLRASNTSQDIETMVLDRIKKQYPTCCSKIFDVSADGGMLDNVIPVQTSTLDNVLWEDQEYIEKIAFMPNQDEGKEHRPIRALLGLVKGHHQALAVLSSDTRKIFDNLDIWFVKECALIVKDALHSRQLQEALAAKEAFLSTIRHELRTPIHGILSSLELLTDELRVMNLLKSTPSNTDASVDSFLRTIRLSGNELMSTINNILRMNAISSAQSSASIPESGYDLGDLERDVLDDVLGNFTEDSLAGISIRYEHKFSPKCRFRIDYETLKEILKALICNSIAATRKGTITITARFHEFDSFLSFDIEDSGTGIPFEDQERIFLAFEKLDAHAKGAGLGLSIAKLMTATLKGKLELIASSIGAGSHFRLEVPAACVDNGLLMSDDLRRISLTSQIPFPGFCVLAHSKKSGHMLSHAESYLLSRGMRASEKLEGSLIVTNEPECFQQFSQALRGLKAPHTVVVVTDCSLTQAWKDCIVDELEQHRTILLAGPLHTARLDEIFSNMDLSPDAPEPTPQECDGVDGLHNGKIATLNGNYRPETKQYTIKGRTSRASSTIPTISMSNLTPEPLSARPLKALLVDDNQINLSVLQYYCKKRKIPHGSATNGHRAVSLFHDARHESTNGTAQPYSLILMDMQMPECNGIEATRSIRDFEKKHDLQRSVIFMITGQDTMADRTASLEAGANEFFTKPVALKRLTQVIGNYFPGSAA